MKFSPTEDNPRCNLAIEAIKKIREEEGSAQGKLRHAQDEAKRVIFEAGLKAQALVKDAADKAAAVAHRALKDAAVLAQKDAQKIIDESKAKQEALRKAASLNMPPAVEFIVGKVKGQWQ